MFLSPSSKRTSRTTVTGLGRAVVVGALRQVDLLLKQGYTYVVDADLKSYFDTIPHDLLMAHIRDKLADNRILSLVELFLKQQIMETTTGWTPETGHTARRCPESVAVQYLLGPS